MKTALTRNLRIFLLFGLALGVAFGLGRACVPPTERKDWVLLSGMFFATRTNVGLVIPTVNVIVSNVGPQKILFGLGWFECRTKSNGAWLGAGQTRTDPDPMHGPSIFLSPESSVRMSMDIKETDKAEDRMAVCEVGWVEREFEFSPIDQLMSRVCNSINLNWRPRFSNPEVEHRAFSANTEVYDYFYTMYWHRTNWTRINTNVNKSMLGLESRVDPGTDEWAAQNALIVFEQFCRGGQ